MTYIQQGETWATTRSKINQVIKVSYTDLLADTELTYTGGASGTVTAGDLYPTTEGNWFEVAASDAVDPHITTAGGVKLYEAGPHFSTRARAAAAWARMVARSETPPVGTVWSFDGVSIEYDGSTTAVPGFSGWKPAGDAVPTHYGATTDDATDDRSAWVAWAANIPQGRNFISSEIVHPNKRGLIDVNIYSNTANPLYVVEGVDDTRLTGRVEQDGQGGTVRFEGDTNGVFVQDMDIVSDGFSLLFKPQLSSGTPTWSQNGVVSRNAVLGEATTADVGISFDGDTRNYIVTENLVRNIQRSDGGANPAHAFAIADGKDVDPSAQDCSTMLLIANVIDDIGGNAFHLEDRSPLCSFSWNVARQIEVGIEITTGSGNEPHLQNYIGNMFSGASEYFIDATGTGYTESTNYAFNIMDGAGVALTTSYGVRINQAATACLNYVFNIHHDFTQTAFQSDASGSFNVIGNVFDNITGDGLNITRSDAVFSLAYNQFRTISGDAISGGSTGVFSPASLRGVRVESNNTFEAITGDILDKANSANIQGDQIAISAELVANVASDDVMFIAMRDGWVTSVSRVATTAPAGGGSAVFTVYATNGGGSTKIIDNGIPATGSLYDTYLWGSENVQIDNNKFSRGDVIRIVCDGASSSANKAKIQLEFFYYD